MFLFNRESKGNQSFANLFCDYSSRWIESCHRCNAAKANGRISELCCVAVRNAMVVISTRSSDWASTKTYSTSSRAGVSLYQIFSDTTSACDTPLLWFLKRKPPFHTLFHLSIPRVPVTDYFSFHRHSCKARRQGQGLC